MANDISILLSARLNQSISYKQLTQDIKSIEKNLKHLELKVKIDKNALTQISNEIKTLQSQIGSFQMGTPSTNSKNIIDQTNQSLKQQSSIQNEIVKSTQNHAKGVQDTNKQILSQSHQWNKIAKEMGFIDNLIISLKRIPSWMIGMTMVYAPLRSFRQGLEGIKDIDQQLIELSKVSGETQMALNGVKDTAIEVSKSLGVSATSILEATTAFARLGYEIKEASRLAEESVIFSTVGNMSVETASTSLTSTIKAFGIDVDEQGKNIRNVIDQVNEVGNNFAISQEDIAVILQHSSSAMREAGNTISETIAIGTAAQEIVQNSHKVGNALKTIGMRIRGISEDGEDLTDLLPTLESDFNRIGLTLMNETGTGFKNTYEIIRDLGSVWGDLDKRFENSDFIKADILEKVAGKRQGQIVAAMLSNYEQMEKALETAQNSAGSAEVEFARATESINFKLNQLSANMAQFWNEAIDSDSVKNLIDGLIRITDGLSSFAQNFDMGKVALFGFATILTLSAKNLKTFEHRLITTVFYSKATRDAVLANKASFIDMNTGTVIASAGLKNLTSSMIAAKLGAAAMTMGISLAITGIIQGVSYLVNKNKEARQEMENLSKTFNDTIRENNKNVEEIKKLGKEYEILTNKTNKTEEEQQRFYEISNRIGEISPKLVTRFDEQGNAVLSLKDNYYQLIEEMERANELKMLEMSWVAPDYYKTISKDIADYRREVDSIQRYGQNILTGGEIQNNLGIIEFTKGLDVLRSQKQALEDLENPTKAQIAQYNALEEEIIRLETIQGLYGSKIRETTLKIQDSTNSFKPYISSLLETRDTFKDLDETSKNYIATFANMPEFFEGKGFNEQVQQLTSLASTLDDMKFSSVVKEIEDLNDSYDPSSIKEYNEKLTQLVTNLIELSGIEIDPNLLFNVFSNGKQEIKDTNENLDNGLSSLRDYAKELEKATESYEDITDKLIAYNKILQEMNSAEGLSGSTKDEIIRKHQELAPYLDNEKQLRQELIGIIGDEEEAQRKAYKEMIMYSETFFNAKLKGNKELVDKLGQYYTADLENAKNLAHAKEMVESKLISKLSEKWARYYRALVAGDSATEHGLVTAAMRGDKEANALLQRYKEIEDAFSGIADSFVSGIDFKGINLSGVKDNKSSNPLDKIFNAFPAYKAQITDLTNSLNTLNKEMSTLENDIKIAESLGQTERAIKLQEQLIAKRAEERDLLHQTANALRGLQAQIERDFKNKFKLNIADLTEVDMKNFNDNIDKQITNLQNKLAKTTTDSAKNAIQTQINALEQDKSMFSFLIDSFKSAGSEIEKLGSGWISSFLGEQSDIKDNVGKKVFEIFKDLDKTLLSSKEKMEDLNYELKMLDSDDTSSKAENIASKMQVLKEIIYLTEQELHKLNSTTPDNIKNTEEFKNKVDELEKSLRDNTVTLKGYADEINSIREKIADQAIAAIKNAYKQQRELTINTLKEELRAEEAAHKRRIDRLNERLSKYEEIIKAQIDSIDRQEDEDQFDKELTKAQEERAEIVRQINILSMDDSLEARAKVSELNKQLTQQDERIEEMKHRRQVALRKQNLNDQLDNYRKDIEEKKKTENEKYDRVKDRIDREIQLEEWKYDELINNEQMYADLKQDIIDGNLKEINSLMEDFLIDFEGYNQRTVRNIESSWQSLLNQIYEVKKAQQSLDSMPSTPSKDSSSSISSGGNYNTGSSRDNQLRYLQKLVETGTYGERKWAENEIRLGRYHEGGVVGNSTRDLPEFINKLFNVKPNEQIVKALKGEVMIPPDNIAKNFIPNIQNLVSSIPSKLVGVGGSGVEIRFDNLINIEGNATKEAIPAIKNAGNQVMEDLRKILVKNGVNVGVRI